MTKKVIFCVPSLNGPTKPFIASLEASLPLITAAGWEDGAVECRGNPYISYARAEMLRKAMDAKADVVVFIDYDMSWKPQDLLTLIETPGDVVAGTYRYKKDDEEYMGAWQVDDENRPIVRADGCIAATRVPAGFLKITKNLVDRFMAAYPALIFGPCYNASVDLFSHGAIERTWYGEDMAFSKRWVDVGGEIWLIPHLDLTHNGDKAYPGNLHEFLLRQPGGSNEVSVPAPSETAVYMTRRQAQVVEGVRKGKPSKVIARDLDISVGTVKIHLSRVMKKIKATNRTEVAVSKALRAG